MSSLLNCVVLCFLLGLGFFKRENSFALIFRFLSRSAVPEKTYNNCLQFYGFCFHMIAFF